MRMRQHIAFQRIESAVIFIASTYIYFDSGFSVVAYVLLLFAFDVSMVGYLKNAKVGAFVYNLAHSDAADYTGALYAHARSRQFLAWNPFAARRVAAAACMDCTGMVADDPALRILC